MSGYSLVPLSFKLGIKPNSIACLLNHPEDYGQLLFPFPEGCSIYDELQPDADFIQYFAKEKKDLENNFGKLKSNLKPNGSLWISWPKKAAKVPTDLDENVIREIGLLQGLVDVKVAAIDETWSGLKFVYRVKDRK